MGFNLFFQWLSDHCAYLGTTSSDRLDGQKGSSASSSAQAFLTKPHSITASPALGFEFFIKGIPLSASTNSESSRNNPCLYTQMQNGQSWRPPWLLKGLGGILWKQGCEPQVAAGDTPQHLVDVLSHRKTQIIPLELMAVAGLMFLLRPHLSG